MIASQSVHRPIRSRNVRIIIGAVDGLRLLLIPACPATPINVATVITSEHIAGLIVEEAFPHAILVFIPLVLNTAPQNLVDKLLILVEFLLVRVSEFFHGCRKPRTSTSFITEARHPNTRILSDYGVCLPVVGHHGGAAMEGIVRVDKPLLGHQEVPQI